MSDDEEVMHSEEEPAPVQDSGPSEAERAMQRRRAQKTIDSSALNEEAQELLAENAELRAKMEEEIDELRRRSEQRKKEREEEERQLAIRRQEEESRRKKEEEERQAKKKAEEAEKNQARAAKMAEFEKWKNDAKPNFIITKRGDGGLPSGEGDEDGNVEKKSKEQIEAEKRAILAQRTPKLEIAGFDSGKLTEKAKELHNLIVRLESEKYDLEKRFKAQQFDMMELAERARSMNKVGRGGLKRIQMGEDEVDKMSERFAGCPSKIVMYSEYERQKDKRSYGERHELYHGPQYLFPAEKIKPQKVLKWSEEGLPIYEEIPGMEGAQEQAAEEE